MVQRPEWIAARFPAAPNPCRGRFFAPLSPHGFLSPRLPHPRAISRGADPSGCSTQPLGS